MYCEQTMRHMTNVWWQNYERVQFEFYSCNAMMLVYMVTGISLLSLPSDVRLWIRKGWALCLAVPLLVRQHIGHPALATVIPKYSVLGYPSQIEVSEEGDQF